MPDQPPKESKRREGSANPDSKTDYQFPRRLALCLDGTWNERDSGTNVYHLSNLILEGKIESAPAAPAEGTAQGAAAQTWVQMVYYDEGVGTGFLDSVTGGAFGIGLSQNVREAYDWLVERYRFGDEVYIFGFSRGAYTARSLVGLIANCGLLYRGAPLPPEQLWNGYQKMAPYPPPLRPDGTRVPVKKWWQPSGAQKEGPFRPLKNLKPDEFPGATRYQSYIPWKEMNETERLLYQWSRRIPIHCLAVFDTVRTLGIEALAIPWLRDRKTEFHKTQLTWLIRNGFHALAIDEHRGNFSHVPWHRKTRSARENEKKARTGGGIQQRWFIGAHSNIGGSYDNGTLAQLPLAWFVTECSRLGLVFKPRRHDEPDVRSKTTLEDAIPLGPGRDLGTGKVKAAHVRDSYAELGGGIWRHMIRAKRHYRRIAPPPEFQDGEEVQSLEEELHDSVPKLIALNTASAGAGKYDPPNLYEFRKRTEHVELPEPPHTYLGSWPAAIWLAVWLGGILGAGKFVGDLLFGPARYWAAVIAIALPALALLVDWSESYLNHKRTVRPHDATVERFDGWLDLLLNLRLLSVGAFAIGIGYFIWRLVPFLFSSFPLVEAIWLALFCMMMMHFNASQMWAARPMREAGFGSITALQNARTPEQVVGLREAWTRLCLRPTDAVKLYQSHHRRDAHRLLPVYRTIWRDRVGFIPAYAIAFCAGLWVALSLLHCWPFGQCHERSVFGLLSLCAACWKPPLFIVLAAAVLDYIEDFNHARYLKKNAPVPSALRVRLGWLVSKIKLVLCGVGTIGLAAAVVLLSWLQVCHACSYLRACSGCTSILRNDFAAVKVPAVLSFLLAGAALYLVFSTIVALFRSEPKVRCR